MLRRCGLLLVTPLALLAVACSGESSPPAGPKALSMNQLLNAEYASQWARDGRAKLVDGQYRESAAPGSVAETLVRATEFAALGDIDGDGIGDGVIVLENDPGGSGVFYELVGVLNRASQPLTLAPIALGDRVQIEGLELAPDGTVRVTLVKHGPDDPQCCPTLNVTLRYRLSGDRLVSVDQEPSRVSASPVSRNIVHSLIPTAPMRS